MIHECRERESIQTVHVLKVYSGTMYMFFRIILTIITTSYRRSRYELSCRRAHDYETTVKASEHSTR